MLLPALTLLLCLAQQTLQGGVKPQSVAYGRPLAAGVNGALGALGSRYGTKAMKTGIGRYPAAHLGTAGGYRNLGLGGRGAMRQGGYGAMQGGYGAMQGGYGARGAYGAGMGTGMGLGPGFANGLGINLGQGGKRGYGAGLGALPGYGGFGGAGYPVSRPGYPAGAGNYLGASVGAGGYGAGLGQGAYLGGAAGKHGGYGDGLTGYLGAVAGNGFGGDAGKTLSAGYGNGFGNGYGTGLDYPAELAVGAEYKAGKSKALGNGGYAAPVQGAFGALGAGLESAGGKYGGAAAPAHYGNAPVIPAALEGDAGYPYAAQQLGLAAEGTKTASKYGATEGFGAQQAGFGVQLGAAQEALGQQQSKYGGVNGGLGNGYKG
ncbi:uncharacterized protein LOC101167291 isoform X8 [Oryzias latipes]